MSNTLGPRQRARLIQSSRKLEAILGVTPQLFHVEDSSSSFGKRPSPASSVSSFSSTESLLPPSPPPKRRRGLTLKLVVASANNSSNKPLPKTPKSGKRIAVAPPPLVLQYHALGTGYDPRASIISTIESEQDHLQTAIPRSPLSPRYHPSTDYRRKRMAKLARTLGENVPPELVFQDLGADSQAADRRQMRAQRGRSWSVGSSNTMPALRTTSISKPSFEIEGRSRKDSLAFQTYKDVPERSVSRADTIRSTYPQLTRSESPALSQHSVDSANTRRKEREWSGEWNAVDMDNVIKSLRDLKAK